MPDKNGLFIFTFQTKFKNFILFWFIWFLFQKHIEVSIIRFTFTVEIKYQK